MNVHIDYNGVGRGHDEFVEKDGRMVCFVCVWGGQGRRVDHLTVRWKW